MCLLKTGACLIQVHFDVFAPFGTLTDACLIQVACLIEVATKTGVTVLSFLSILLHTFFYFELSIFSLFIKFLQFCFKFCNWLTNEEII